MTAAAGEEHGGTVAKLERVQHLLDLNRDAAAGELAASLLADDPENAALLCLLANARLGTKDPLGAIRAAEAAAALSPDDGWPLRLAALGHAAAKHPGPALDHARRAVTVEPQDWSTHYVLGRVLLMNGIAHPVEEYEAERATREAIARNPDNGDARELLGDVLLAIGRRDAARDAYRQALQLAPGHAGALEGLAVLDSRRNLGRAAKGFASAAAASPTDSSAVRNLIVMGARALRVVQLVLWLVLITAGRLASRNHSQLSAQIGFAVAAGALAVFAVVVWSGARPRTWQLVRIVLRRDRMLALWSGCLVAGFAALGVAALVSGAMGLALIVLMLSLIAGVVLSWAHDPADSAR